MSPRYELNRDDRRAALKIVAIYVVAAGLWIYASDTLLGVFIHGSAGLVAYSKLKGVAFIVVTACFFYFFVARYLRQRQIDHILWQANRDLEEQVRERTRAAEESEERYRALVLSSSDVVYRMSPDWKELREFKDRNFRSETEAPITDWLEKYIHPDDRSHVMEVVNEVIRTGSVFELEHRVLQADGTVGWTFSRAVPLYDHAGNLVEWIGHASDVTRHKEAEEAVKKSERKFSTFFHAASVMMTITTFEEGRVLDINDVALQALGYEREEIIGKTVYQAHVWEDPADRERAVQMLEEQGSLRDYEIRIRGKGQLKVGLLSAELIVIDGERWILAIVRDITEHKRSVEALQKSEKKFATIFHHVPALLSISTLEEGRYVDVNETILRTLGYQREEMIGRTPAELNLWEDLSFRTQILQTLEAQGAVKNLEVRLRGKEGQTILGLFSAEYIDINGDRYVLSLTKDITLKRQAQEQVELLNTQLSARAAELEEVNRELADDLEAMRILQKLGMLFLHEKNLEQILSEVLDAAVAISGADFGNIQILDPETSFLHVAVQRGFPQWWLDYWNNVIEGHGVCGTALKRGERVVVEDIEQSPIFTGTDSLDIQRKAGVRAVQSTPLVSRAGDFLGMFSTHYKEPHQPTDRELRLLDLLARHAADFIEQAKLMEMLEARAVELEEVNSELEAFNYSVAHDLRNPLNLINGYAQIIMMVCGDKMDEVCTGCLQQTIDGVNRMNKLISALLDFSRMARSELHRESVDLSDIALAVAAELKQSEPKRRADFRIGEGIVADGDKVLLRLVLDNLLGNAFKYTAMRGEAIIEFGATEVDGQAACFVRDNGPGFDMSDAGKLFVPFQRLAGTAKLKGLGIGLATADRIIRRHGGRIWAEGEKDKGATFYFTLPQIGS